MSTRTPPVIEMAIEPRAPADQQRLGAALSALAAEDEAFEFTIDHVSGQAIMRG